VILGVLCPLESKNMNPYALPTVALQQALRPERMTRKNPSRFLLYPLAAVCISLFLAAAYRYQISGFKLTTVHFLDAGIQILIGLFGTSAFFLANRQLSKTTRRFTIFWSISAIIVLAISMFVDRLPTSIQELSLIVAFFATFLMVGFLAFRSDPREPILVSESKT